MNEQNLNMSVYDIPVDQISPNPYQPRVEFNEQALSSLAASIKQYGVMQPIVVTKKGEGSFELISGERRLRASKLAGNPTIPAVIRGNEHSDAEKFELAIIENLQREDLNPIDKAKSFKRLVEEFNLTHSDIAQKMGKSREYISNSLRILMLPDVMLEAMVKEDISEGHARPLLMLKDRPFEQGELFKKIVSDKLTVRAAEKIARSVAVEKVRKQDTQEDSDLKVMEKKLAEKLGTKVYIDKKTSGEGGKLTIEYFSKEDLEKIINLVRGKGLSSAPVLESDDKQDYAIDKFEDNFSLDKKVGQEPLEDFSKKEPKVFGDEIKNLVENNMSDNKINLDDKIKSGGNTENFGGFNITSFDENVQVENYSNDSSINNMGDRSESNDAYFKDSTSTQEEVFQPPVSETENSNEITSDDEKNNVEEKKFYGETFSDFGEIDNFNLAPKKDSEIIEEDGLEKVATKQEENMVFDQPVVDDITVQLKSDEVKPDLIVSPQEEVEENVLHEKSEAQKRIDAILAGSTTVGEEYGIENQSNNITEEKKDNLHENGSIPEMKEEKRDIEQSSIYQQFLESKKKVEREKEESFVEKEEVLSNTKEKGDDPVLVIDDVIDLKAGMPEGNSEEFFEGSETIDMGGVDTLSEDVMGVNIKGESGEKEQVESIFNGDDFIPRKEDSGYNDEQKKGNADGAGFGFSI